MIKNCAKRKLIITTFALLIFLITLTFPKTEDEIKNVTITYMKTNESPIYLLNNEDLVVRTSISIKSEDIINKAKEMIEILTINNAKSAYIPNFFKPIIPNNTKILSVDVQDTTLKINFSKELLNVDENYSEKMIESLVYSLTELDGVNGIIIYVEGKLLETIPSTNKKLPPLLTRDIGINKVYNLSNLKNVSKTTTYYIAKENNSSYYVPVTLLENNEKDKVEIIIERLKTSPSIKTNLISYLSANTELTNYELLENEIQLSFNPLLYEGLASKDLEEEVKYSISLSLKDTLNIKNVTFIE